MISGVSLNVLQVVTVSTRPGRVGPTVADWFTQVARTHGGFEVEPVDLAEVGLPLYDEPNHPRLRDYVHEHTKRWSRIVQRGDAFVFVTPEYNFAIPASFKNAIDYLQHEWKYKPVAFVSYGGVSGGLRAVQMAKQVVTTVGLMPGTAQVVVPFVAGQIHDGTFSANELQDQSAKAMLDELTALTTALKPLRSS